jgi:oxygen-independent coproporphyrinogen-3 oxidase
LPEGDLDAYIDLLCRELSECERRVCIRERTVKAIYFGGGTPTIFSANQIEKVLDSLHRHVVLEEGCEITFESTLHNLTPEKISVFNSHGVNRLSLGAQTFSDRGRKLLTRTFNGAEALDRVRRAKEVFRGTLSVDIIYGYPGQTIDELRHDIQEVNQVMPDSVSFYSLRLHPSSDLAKMIASKKIFFNTDLLHEKKFHHLFLDEMRSNGYDVLDLLKVCRENRDAHRYYKMKYRMADVLPIGVGAGGLIGSIEFYKLGSGVAMYSYFGPLIRRYMKILALMQHPVINLAEVQQLSSPESVRRLREKLPALEESGLVLCERDSEYELTNDGIFWGNNIATILIKTLIEGDLGLRKDEHLTPKQQSTK